MGLIRGKVILGIFGIISLLVLGGREISAEKTDSSKLQRHLQMCQAAGSSVDCAKAGAMLAGRGKVSEAKKLFQKACEALIRPIGAACYFWGLYSKEKSVKLAAFLKACKLGDADGCTFFGDLIKKSEPKRALKAYRFGCKFGDGRACFSLWMETSPDKISPKLKRSCRLSYPKGCLQLGILLSKRGDKFRSARAFRRACALLSGRSCYSLLQKNIKNLPPAGRKILLETTCKKGYKRACSQKK